MQRRLIVAIISAAASFATATILPSDLRNAYGFSALNSTYTGAGQTIAIYTADYYSTLQADVDSFSSAYMGGQSTTVKIVATDGTDLTGKKGTADAELSLDVEYAHLIAPQAKIVVVYNSSVSPAALYASQTLGASVVSISYGSYENNVSDSSITASDARYKTTAGMNTAVFAAAGDSSHYDYAASSPYVVGVGGTNIYVNSSGVRTSEVGWHGGGGGQSRFMNEQLWQQGVQQSGHREGPDVSLAAGGDSALPVYSADATNGFGYYAGTSIATPIWAGLAALADQGRVANGLKPLGTTDLLTLLYGLAANPTTYNKAFYDVTTGTNDSGVSAGTGFDMLTGLGTPNVSYLVPYLSTAAVPEPAALGLIAMLGAFALRRRR